MSTSSPSSPDRAALLEAMSQQVGRDLAAKTVLFHDAIARRLSLNVTDLKCLDLLRQSGTPLTATNLAARTGLTGGAVTGIADRLEAAGFVERVRDASDRRRWELRLKKDRQDEVAALFAPLTGALTELASGYSDGELELLLGFLDRLSGVMDGQITRLQDGND